jgi:hypothetical protein
MVLPHVTPIGLWSPALGIGVGGPTDRELSTLMRVCDGSSIANTTVGGVVHNLAAYVNSTARMFGKQGIAGPISGQYFRQCRTSKRGGGGLQGGDVGREILELARRHDLGDQILSRSDQLFGICRAPSFSCRTKVGVGRIGKRHGSSSRVANSHILKPDKDCGKHHLCRGLLHAKRKLCIRLLLLR